MNESDIDRLLRQETPDVTVRPGLETRIHASLRQPPKRRSRKLAWLALPAAAALTIAFLIASRNQPAPPEIAKTKEETPPPPVEVVQSLVPEIVEDDINPLRSETRALQNDAKRTGRFLLDHLPSLALKDK